MWRILRRIREWIHDLFFGGIWRRIGWVTIAFFFGAATAIALRETIFSALIAPAGGQLSPFEGGLPVYNEPGGILSTVIKTGIKAGFITAIPVVWIYVMTLIKPWLPGRFWWFTFWFTIASVSSSVAGVSFVYFVMMPAGLGFLLNFGNDIATPVILISAYMGLLTSMMLSLVIIFQLPLLMYSTVRIGVMSYSRFTLFRKFFIPTAIFFGTLLSPGADLVNALLLIVPMILLYEVGLFVAWLADPTQGDYLFIKAIWGRIFWVLRRPVVAWRKVERELVRHGIIGW
jgi:sec-independent protein translocase protein TatC